ncbi:MAG: Holliday junction branch migration protein RuvA [Chitinophagaceae bacterium]|nr:Holliday junction branch migration protein RuvA [Chitinophagaceae bacterium]MCW5929666.1 Holliday junction branch migration protein RuvA [Chitinophagaceae bacterium]
MIAFLSGNFVYKSPAVVHVEINGLGYEVQVSLNTYSKIQSLDKGLLHTWLHIKEDGHTLYGFADLTEKNIFLQLISVNGIGTSTARMMLSSLRPEELSDAIYKGDTQKLEKVKGIGKKSAERIVLELRDKISKHLSDTTSFALKNNTLEQDALNALVALGIARNAAEAAVKKAASAASTENLETLIKTALQLI